MPPSAQQQLAEWWGKRLPVWRADPVLFVTEVLGGPPLWDKQKEILRAIATHAQVNVAAANGVGKSYVTARAILWRLFCFPDAIVVTTAPTAKQVDTLWSELRAAYRSSKVPLGGELQDGTARLWISDKHYAMGVVAKEVNAAAGYHSPYMLGILEEAAGVPPFAEEAILGCCIGEFDKVVRIGNPLCGPTEPFARAFAVSSPNVKNIRITAEDSPNVIAGRTVVPGLMTREGMARLAEQYGVNSDPYRARVLARFPSGSANSLITLDHLTAAESRWVAAWGDGSLALDADAEVRIGCDVGRHHDPSVAYVRVGGRAFKPSNGIQKNMDGIQVARWLASLAKQYGARSLALDGGGLGASPVDALIDLQRRGEIPASLQIYDVQFGGGATDRHEHLNKRTELWVRTRDWLWEEGAIKADPDLAEELLAVTYGWARGSAMKLEEKDAVCKRLGRSPDRADALALAVAGHVGKVRQRGALTVHWV